MGPLQEVEVVRDGAAINIGGRITLRSFRRVLAVIHDVVDRAGYQDIVLNFANCAHADGAPMLAICCQLVAMREEGVSADLLLPTKSSVSRLFINTNWASLLDPAHFNTSRWVANVPATSFRSAAERQTAMNGIARALLASADDVEQDQIEAFESSINEVTKNVLVHAMSRVGGLVQMRNYNTAYKIIEFDVCDPGIGIPASIRRAHRQIADDSQALAHAMREGVTGNPKIGAGNGLFETHRVCAVSKGTLQIHSGYANLTYSEAGGLQVHSEQIPYAGTLVVARVCFAKKAAV
jgi:hypothetical protein